MFTKLKKFSKHNFNFNHRLLTFYKNLDFKQSICFCSVSYYKLIDFSNL